MENGKSLLTLPGRAADNIGNKLTDIRELLGGKDLNCAFAHAGEGRSVLNAVGKSADDLPRNGVRNSFSKAVGESSKKLESSVSKGSQTFIDSIKSLNSAEKVNLETAEQVNEYWKTVRKYSDSPFTEQTKVETVKLTESSQDEFVRTYGGASENGKLSLMGGPWVMLKKDIEGLTAKQIKEKYALPSIPTKYADVSFEPGDVLRYGKTAPNFGGVGGGVQFDITMNEGFIGEFKDMGEIPAGGIK